MPSAKYFADKVFPSSNFFGDMIRKHNGQTASEYLQDKVIDRAYRALLSSGKTMAQIACDLGFQYPRYLSSTFKKAEGVIPMSIGRRSRHDGFFYRRS